MKIPLCLALAAALTAPAANAEPMTFDAAIRQAQAAAPSLAARSSDLKSAQVAATAAGRLPDPKLRVGLDNIPVTGPVAGSLTGDSMTMGSVGFVQDVPNADKRRSARLKASADIEIANANRAVETRDVRLGAALAWTDLYYAEKKLAALDEAAVSIRTLKDTAPSQVASGALRPAQALEADGLLAALDDRRADLVADVARARAELIRWTGDAAAEVSGTPPEYEVDPSNLRANLDHNPQLLASAAQILAADAEVAQARADKRSDWGWDVAYQRRDPRWGDMVSAGVTISLPLFQKSRQDAMIDAKSTAATSARLQADATRRQVQAQLNGDIADHQMHHDRTHRAEATLVPLAEQKLNLEKSSYAAGTASLSDVLEAQIAVAEAHIDLLSRQGDVVRDGVRLNIVYGSVSQ